MIQVFSDSELNWIFPSGVLYSSWLAPVEFRYSVWNVFGAACQKWKNRKGFFWRSCKRPCSFGPRHTLRHAKRIITHALNIEIQAPFKLDSCSMLFLLLPRAPTVLARDRAVHNMLRLGLFFQDFEPGTLYHVNVLARTLQNLRSLVSHPLLQLTVWREEPRHWAPLCLPVLTLDGKACIFLPNSKDQHFFGKHFGISLFFFAVQVGKRAGFWRGKLQALLFCWCTTIPAIHFWKGLGGPRSFILGPVLILVMVCFARGLEVDQHFTYSGIILGVAHVWSAPGLVPPALYRHGLQKSRPTEMPTQFEYVRVMFVPHRQGQVNVNAMMRRIELPSWGRRPARFNTAKQNACRWWTKNKKSAVVLGRSVCLQFTSTLPVSRRPTVQSRRMEQDSTHRFLKGVMIHCLKVAPSAAMLSLPDPWVWEKVTS